ncbi:MAG: RES domain-containing protein [Gammaproteobacteria bacterium]|nr:RES domain-containing protein [Gammaproteobacteria bacterium]
MRFRGLVYRAHNPRWNWSPPSGEGARRYGGRFNRAGVPALYTSLSPLTAMREASPIGRPLQPITLCAYEVDAEPVFDALDSSQLEARGLVEEELRCPNWEREMLAGIIPASQRLADWLITAGYVGMRVQSFAPGAGTNDLNLVLWRWGNQLPGKVVLVDDEERLSKDSFSGTS